MAGDRGRSLQLSLAGRHKADTALLSVGTKRDLAADLRMSPTTITNFFKGRNVARQQFLKICQKLKLEVEEVVESLEVEQSNIDLLVQKVRKQIRPQIQEKCGKMRVLDMVQPIKLDKIYTHVNILEKITGRRGLEVSELMRDTDPEKFDRFCLGNVQEKRIPGLEAIEKFSKLMILGKPGAGKTTFLRYLAIYYISSKSPASPVPLFITLKDFAEAEGEPDLLKYIEQSILSGVERHTTPLLNAGRTLILLDGLDEVREADNSRVLKQIRNFSQQFPQNKYVITCRIAAREYIFEQLTDVEMADFDDEQITDFSSKWFYSKNDPIKAKRFMEKLKEKPPIRELATNPLLLTLLCLVFENFGSFLNNRAELYERGLEVLLRKWDATRNIEREEVYKQLSLKRKEDLLSYIAYTTFEVGNYFFKQREVTTYINQYIQNLPNASTDPDTLTLDSLAVLKSIEAQHGLFTERAQGIYSFSHLTFHEYLTARKIETSCNPYNQEDPTLESLVYHFIDKRWREVFLLTVSRLNSADVLVWLMKGKIDKLLVDDKKIQDLLYWIQEKTTELNISIRNSLIKLFYFDVFYECYVENVFKLPYWERLINREKFKNIDFLTLDESLMTALYYANMINESFCSGHNGNDWFQIIAYEAVDTLILKSIPHSKPFPSLNKKLEELNGELPELDEYALPNDVTIIWWGNYGKSWTLELESTMIQYRNIGHNWQFSLAQEELLKQYYNANKLLVDCLNSDCVISQFVRKEIEETLLLPIAEIEKREQAKKVTPSS